MKTRTSQNGVAGIMSRLLHNIKSAALALAALVLAAPPVWGAYTSGMQWKDGVSGNLNAAGNWTGGKAPASGNVLGFVNSGAGVSYVTNSAAASYQPRFDKGNFVLVASKTLTANNAFHLASGDGNYTGPASVTKYGDVVAKGYLHLAQVANSHAYFTNMTGRLVANDTTTGAHQNGLRLATGQGAEAEFVIQGGYAVSSNGVTIAHGSDSTGRMIINGGYFFSYGNGNGKKVGTNTVAHASNSTGLIEINGGAYTNENWLFVGNTAGATGTIHVKNGTFNQKCTTANSFVVGGARSTASHGYYIQEGGTATAAAAMIVGFANGADGHVFMKGGTLNLNGQNLHVGPTNGGSGEFVQSGGSVNVNMDFKLGRAGAGTLTVSNGTFTVASGKQIYMCEVNTGNATVNLCGGTLVTKHMSMGPGTAVVNFDGGTLKANNTSNDGLIQATVPVNVGPKGGTIDTGNRAITVPAVLASGVSGETDGGMTFKGGGTVTLTGANTYTGVTVIDAGTTIQMPAASNLAGNIVVTNATFADCPLTVLTLTGGSDVDAALLARCSLAADAPDTVELTADGASVVVTAKASVPVTARKVYDSGAYVWRFYDVNGNLITGAVDESALAAGSVTVIFGSTAELAAIGTAPAWVGGWQMASTFTFDPSSSASLPAGYTFDAGTVIDLKDCNWTLPDEWKSATVDFIVTNSVDATKAVLTVDVASGATFTETHLTLGGNLELRKTGAGTYAMTKDQQHTGGSVVTAGTMTRAGAVTVGVVTDSSQSLSVEGGSFTTSNSGNLVVGANGAGEFTITNATATMNSLYVGNGTGAGTMNINGGQVTVSGWSYLANSATSGGAVLNLNGGTLATRRINVGTTADSLILFNGGTLHINGLTNDGFTLGTSGGAPPEHLTIAVAEKGGTIKTTNNDDRVKVCAGVVKADGVAADGGLKIVGGGKLTFTGSLAYTGGTTVEIGTTLVVPDTSLGGALAASLPATQFAVGTTNTLVTTTGAGTFTACDLPDVSACPFYRAMLSDDAKSILVVRVAPAMSVTGFDPVTGEITLGFENMDGALDVVVAWDSSDHGATLTSWPSGKSVILGTVAAGATTGTFTLPAEVLNVGTHYRLFLGGGADTVYDQEVRWIRPTALGAYIKTDYKPTAGSTMYARINLNSRTYSAEPDFYQASGNYRIGISTAGTSFHVYMPGNGNDTFGTYSASSDLKISMHYVKGTSNVFFVNGAGKASNNFNWGGSNYNVTDSSNPLYIFSNYGGTDRYSRPILYSMSWTNSSNKVAADFIPVKKGSEYGLYDKVAKKLYRNAGTQAFECTDSTVVSLGPVTFADGQMTASDAQQYHGATVLDTANCSITQSGSTATINWSLTQPGGASAEIVAVYQTGSSYVTNVIASGAVAGDTGSYTQNDLWATGAFTITLFARSGQYESEKVVKNCSATTVASVPSAPALSADETLHQIAASGTVALGSGTTVAWLDYGATTSYGKKIDLTLNEGAWAATIPYDDVLWNAGVVHVRVTASNEVTGVFGSSKCQNSATANTTFATAGRTVTQGKLNSKTGEVPLTFGGGAMAAQVLVVAWGDHDYGDDLASWPSANRKVIDTVAADATTGTFTLPAEARALGTYYRFFLGDSAIVPYDEEVAWIQPASSGAYMKTGYTPVASSRAEFKFNMDNQTYDSGYKTIVGVSDGWPRGLRVSVNNDGWMQNVRVGTMRFAELGKTGFSKTADHVVKLNFGQTTTCFTIDDKNNDNIYHEYTDGSSTVTTSYNTYNNTSYAGPNNPLTIWANDGGGSPSMVKIYYLKWMNSSGTVQREYIPVVKDGEYCLYDKNTGTLLHNAGVEGTSFTGGARTAYSPVTFTTVQTAASGSNRVLKRGSVIAVY